MRSWWRLRQTLLVNIWLDGDDITLNRENADFSSSFLCCSNNRTSRVKIEAFSEERLVLFRVKIFFVKLNEVQRERRKKQENIFQIHLHLQRRSLKNQQNIFLRLHVFLSTKIWFIENLSQSTRDFSSKISFWRTSFSTKTFKVDDRKKVKQSEWDNFAFIVWLLRIDLSGDRCWQLTRRIVNFLYESSIKWKSRHWLWLVENRSITSNFFLRARIEENKRNLSVSLFDAVGMFCSAELLLFSWTNDNFDTFYRSVSEWMISICSRKWQITSCLCLSSQFWCLNLNEFHWSCRYVCLDLSS